jgi:hypothetical protein
MENNEWTQKRVQTRSDTSVCQKSGNNVSAPKKSFQPIVYFQNGSQCGKTSKGKK